MFDNYRFLVVSVVFLLYTSYHSHLVTCKWWFAYLLGGDKKLGIFFKFFKNVSKSFF
jgi:hypothetical protein